MAFPFRKKILQRINSFIGFKPVGFDISDLSIKYLKLKPKGLAFDFFGEISLPEHVIENGVIKKEEDLAGLLSSWLSGEGRKIRGSFVVFSLPEEKSFMRVIQVPKIKADELANAIRWEIEANVPVPVDELVYDFEATESKVIDLDHFDVTISAFPRAILEPYIRVLKKIGLRPFAAELESQSIVRSLLPTLEGCPKIIVDMGRTRTSIVVFAGGAIVYTTTVEMGGKMIEESIMKTLNVSKEEALRIKKEKGFDRKEYGGKLFDAMVPPISAFADELKRTILYYQTHSTHAHKTGEVVEEVLLVGGDANLLGLETYLSSVLKVPTRVADPMDSFVRKNQFIPSFPRTEALAFSTAIGLALRADTGVSL